MSPVTLGTLMAPVSFLEILDTLFKGDFDKEVGGTAELLFIWFISTFGEACGSLVLSLL